MRSMKKGVTFFLVLFFSLFVSSATNRALLIGVSKYEDSSWKYLHSLNDVSILQQSLSKDFKIITLLDKDATYKNIKNNLSRLCNMTQPGDTVLIHFSGHGQQMVAVGKEEVDGLDEALVPYDAYLIYKQGFYEGQCHLRDDEFSMYVNNIRKKLNGKGLIMVAIDSCHSGNFDRGELEDEEEDIEDPVERGMNSIFGEETLSATERVKLTSIRIKTDHSSITSPGCNVIYISACQPRETDKEMKDNTTGVSYGPLSYCLSKAYQQYGLSNVNSLINEVALLMIKYAPAQNAMFTNSFGFEPSVK